MTPLELAQRDALAQCKFSPGTTAKRFVRQLAERDPATPLSEKQSAFLDQLAHSYRRQIGQCMAKVCVCSGPREPKVHRQGWDTRHMRRLGMATLCGHPHHPHVERAIVSDEIFPLVPDAMRCRTCDRAKATAALHWARLHVDEWRIEFELLFLAFARLATDMLELRRDPTWRHRCYHRVWQSGEHSLIEPCGGCGSVSLLDVVTWSVGARGWHPKFDSRDVVRHEDADTASDGQRTTFGNWCRKCLRVVGEFHKIDCRQHRLTAAERRLAKACALRPDSNYAAFIAGVRSAGEIQESEATP